MRDQAFCALRRVTIYWAQQTNLTTGLDLLLGCKALRSLEIRTSEKALTKRQQIQHEPILKCFRLEAFGINPPVDTVVSSNGKYEAWLFGLRNLITSGEKRTTAQQKRVENLAKLRYVAEWSIFIID